MKTVYLHLGTPKTATSSIQVACERNSKLLRKYGYSFPLFSYKYPGVRIERNGHFLVEASVMSSRIPDSDISWQERLKLGLDMIHTELENYDNVILTDESLWRSLNYNRQSPLQLLQKDADEYGYDIKLVVYLRRQDSFLISRWNQFVKEGKMNTSLAEHLDWMLEHEPLVVDYASALDRLSSQIGRENIIVRRFEPSSWVGGTIYTDFVKAVGLPSDLPLQPPARDVNPGLKGNMVEMQLLLNRLPSLSLEDKVYFSRFSKKISERLPAKDQYNIFSAEETLQFLEQFRKGNEHVVTEYIRDGQPLFSYEVKDFPKWSQNNPWFLKDTADFLCELPAKKRAFLMNALPMETQVLFLTAMVLRLETRVADLEKLNAGEEKNDGKNQDLITKISRKIGSLSHPMEQ
ncbi:MAG: hypothetical protein LUD12_08295 [Lachnospiraceae bacterium]|nr:hypothetical protein [Lachnospiraceae bacterium]